MQVSFGFCFFDFCSTPIVQHKRDGRLMRNEFEMLTKEISPLSRGVDNRFLFYGRIQQLPSVQYSRKESNGSSALFAVAEMTTSDASHPTTNCRVSSMDKTTNRQPASPETRAPL